MEQNKETTKNTMNQENLDALKVLSTKGEKEFIKHVFSNRKNKKKNISYSEMRALYG